MFQDIQETALQQLTRSLSSGENGVAAGLAGSQRAFLLSRLFKNLTSPMVVTVPTAGDADRLEKELGLFLGKNRIIRFPHYHMRGYGNVSLHTETAGPAHRLSA